MDRWKIKGWNSGIGKISGWIFGFWNSTFGNFGLFANGMKNADYWNSCFLQIELRRLEAGKFKSWNSNVRLFTVFLLFTACQNTNENSTANSKKNSKNGVLVFQTDFGVKDGAVSAMKGVATGVDPNLKLYDLTHEIPAYNIWEGAYRLEQTAAYWPTGTVFVSVVDPGVGTSRKSVVMRSRSGHFFVTPDNGTLTLVAESLGIDAVREINEELNGRQNSGKSYTFHGRDVYAYTGARLAAGVISFEEVGNLLPDSVVRIPYQPAQFRGDSIVGNIPILDIQYGNVWTNINDSVFKSLQVAPGQNIEVSIRNNGSLSFHQALPFVHTFGDVAEEKTLAYMNSLMNFSLAINMGNFSDSFRVKSGPEWTVVIRKSK